MTANCANCGRFTDEDDHDDGFDLCSDCWYVRLHAYGVEWFVETRKKVIRDQNYRCFDCGMGQSEAKKRYGKRLSVHHIVPRACGGSDDPANLVALCSACHRVRENTT